MTDWRIRLRDADRALEPRELSPEQAQRLRRTGRRRSGVAVRSRPRWSLHVRC